MKQFCLLRRTCRLSAPWLLAALVAGFGTIPPAVADLREPATPTRIDAETSFDDLRPYSGRGPALDQRLRSVVRQMANGAAPCPNSTVLLPSASDFQVCGSDDIETLWELLGSMAPVLEPGRMSSFFVADMSGDGERDLIVSYRLEACFDASPAADGICRAPIDYLVVSLFQWIGDRYQVSHAGNFLFGELHAVTTFGDDMRQKKLLIRFESCFACHSWTYLFVVEFGADPDGTAFEFTYADDHKRWNPLIEYSLPGAGHSVEAVTDTRIPQSGGADGLHLMQFFDMEEGGDEWWLFRCQGHHCDYELFLNALPAEYQAIWDGASRL